MIAKCGFPDPPVEALTPEQQEKAVLGMEPIALSVWAAEKVAGWVERPRLFPMAPLWWDYRKGFARDADFHSNLNSMAELEAVGRQTFLVDWESEVVRRQGDRRYGVRWSLRSKAGPCIHTVMVYDAAECVGRLRSFCWAWLVATRNQYLPPAETGTRIIHERTAP